MVQEVLLITPGRYVSDDFGIYFKSGKVPNEYRLTLKGIEDARWLGDNINKSKSTPSFIFYTKEEMCTQTALIIAGRVKSIQNIPPAIAAKPINEREAHLRRGKTLEKYEKNRDLFWRNFREAFRTDEGIRHYFSDLQIISNDVKQIAVVSTPAFNGVFNNCKDGKGAKSYPFWMNPIIYKFNVQKQSIDPIVPYDGRFGYI